MRLAGSEQELQAAEDEIKNLIKGPLKDSLSAAPPYVFESVVYM